MSDKSNLSMMIARRLSSLTTASIISLLRDTEISFEMLHTCQGSVDILSGLGAVTLTLVFTCLGS